MKLKYVTVYWQDIGLSLYTEIAEQFGLWQGARIRDKDQYWAVLRANAECGIAECTLRIAMAEDFDAEINPPPPQTT